MNFFNLLFCFAITHFIVCPPVSNNKKDDEIDIDLEKLLGNIDYSSYLSQVMKELQQDADFNNNVNDSVDSNSVSDALKFASNRVRSRLDELKRLEIIRLAKLQLELDKRHNQVNRNNHPHEIPSPPMASNMIDMTHLDDRNPESFNEDDLKKLIKKTTEIFNQIDRRADDDYKVHEMEKDADRRSQFERDHKDGQVQEKRRQIREHAKIHDPGSLGHLKEVWRVQDKMDDDSFNPKLFFNMHDLNQDGYLDIAELETILQTELDKAYDPGSNDTDYVERYHEMMRMRQSLLRHVDTDENRLVSLEEFQRWTESDQFKKTTGTAESSWKTQEEHDPVYSSDEFDEFYKEYITKHPQLHIPPPHPTPQSPTTTPGNSPQQ